MRQLLIADTGPLIALARINHISLLSKLYTTVKIPGKVWEELEISSNRPGAKNLIIAFEKDWIGVQNIPNPPSKMISMAVDEGEAEAIALALTLKKSNPHLLIDDRRGRTVAKKQGVRVVGTGAILIAAKKHGFLDKVSPVLESLSLCGYRLSQSLQAKILAIAGE